MGKIKYMNVGSFEQVLYSKRWLGKSGKNAINIAYPYLYCFHTYIFIGILGMLCVEFICY
jgi:hypothetical protein